MTNSHSTVSYADLENLSHQNVYPIARVAEEEGEYGVDPTPPTAISLNSEALRDYLKHRAEQNRNLTTRIHMQLEDMEIYLQQQEGEDIDIFELLVEHTLIADEIPAHIISDLLGVLDDDAVFNLESRTIRHAGEFVRDVLKQKMVRRHLRHYDGEKNTEEESEE